MTGRMASARKYPKLAMPSGPSPSKYVLVIASNIRDASANSFSVRSELSFSSRV